MISTVPVSKSPLSIRLTNVAKKYDGNRIFTNVNIEFEAGKKYAITGPNGSGKSTLLKIIAGITTPNSGKVEITALGNTIEHDTLYKEISFCAPYMELPEELNLEELLAFHQNLRGINISAEQLMSELQLEPEKEIRNYSSGMKQRLKLALAFYTGAKILLLDEPAAALDEHWVNWYLQTIQKTAVGKLLIISSNVAAEYAFCDKVFNILDYKK